MSSRNALITRLCRPESYPHPVTKIDVIETHISWVLLTGAFAYKLKKPVDLGFVDYSTLELRAHCCLEELRLNRRYAAEIYLDVVPITGTPESPLMGGQGPAIEFAVRMRQFPQSALISSKLAAGELTAERIDRLARRIGQFHDAADVAKSASPFATPEEIRQEAIENLDVLQELLPIEFQERLPSLRGWTEQSFERLKETFAARRHAGCVRECHGDLHLGNIIEWGGEFIPFDGIEFNPGFRWIDVLSDSAFVAMDLEDRGRPDFAHRFANAIFEWTGDYAGLSVWRWYLVYRALVRAKVAAIRMAQADSSSRDALQGSKAGIPWPAWEECLTYLQLAERYITPEPRRLFITHGVSGSGKTTGTNSLIDQTGTFRVRSDIERKRLFGLSPEDRSASAVGSGIYSSEATARTYDRLFDCATQILEANETALVDATFLTRGVRDRFRHLAARFRAEFQILQFTADENTLRQRIRDRQTAGHDASEATLEVLDRQLALVEPLADDERA